MNSVMLILNAAAGGLFLTLAFYHYRNNNINKAIFWAILEAILVYAI